MKRTPVRSAARWLLRWCYDSCVAWGTGLLGVPLPGPCDPRLDDGLTGWAAAVVRRSCGGSPGEPGAGIGSEAPGE